MTQYLTFTQELPPSEDYENLEFGLHGSPMNDTISVSIRALDESSKDRVVLSLEHLKIIYDAAMALEFACKKISSGGENA